MCYLSWHFVMLKKQGGQKQKKNCFYDYHFAVVFGQIIY